MVETVPPPVDVREIQDPIFHARRQAIIETVATEIYIQKMQGSDVRHPDSLHTQAQESIRAAEVLLQELDLHWKRLERLSS